MSVRNRLAWHLFNLGCRVADEWYGNMIVGSVFYGLDKAARDAGHVGSPIAPSDEYRRRVIASLLRDGERIVKGDGAKENPPQRRSVGRYARSRKRATA